MSIQRFINSETILTLNGGRYGQLFLDSDLNVLNDFILIPHDPNIVKDQISELHIFSFYGDYITGNHNASYTAFEPNTNSLLLNVGKTFKEANIQNGSYVIVSNLFKPLFGSFGEESVFIKEISSDRTEIKFVVAERYISQLNEFRKQLETFSKTDILNNVVVNFGFNRIQKIINYWFDEDGKTIYVKLYQPIFDEIDVLNKAYFVFECIDPYVDTITFSSPVVGGNTTVIPGPNYYLDTSKYTGESTIFKSWDDMLDSNLPTTQQIIEQSLSSSNLVRLNIDYTDFNNFVFYSSAKERVENFYYKIGKIEEYNSSIKILNESTASNTTYISGAKSINQKRIDQIVTTFDPFEKWLYYAPTASIFTHDVTGSITPFPKQIIANKTVSYNLTSSIVTQWYDSVKSVAQTYDQTNMNRLYWAIPEHIIMDEGNSNLILFADMIGQHYDTIYSYIKALPQIHERDEHPERGFSNDLAFYIAKSFGWDLQNTRQLSDLWKYKLGTEKDGTLIQSGSLVNYTHEGQTHQIWRRIINNLPHLYKTKGTMRSVKSLMSIYGIPQTLISIKEYGGPSADPTLIDDRYYFKSNFTGSNWIELPRRTVTSSLGTVQVPESIDFRFSTTYSSSLSMSIWAIEGVDRTVLNSNLSLHHFGNKYSGSYEYGYLKFNLKDNNSNSITVSSSLLPIYNNDFWNVSIVNKNVSENFTFYDNDTDLGVSGSRYYLSSVNDYGYSQGVVKSSDVPTNHYSTDASASLAGQPFTQSYFVSPSNPYGLAPYISKFISGSVTTYDSYFSASLGGVQIGQTFAVAPTNQWGLPRDVEILLLPTIDLEITVQSSKDCSHGKISHSDKFNWISSIGITDTWETGSILLGGTTGSNSNRFVGNITSYKEYFESLSDATLISHTRNPAAYNGNSPTSSYYTLYRYFPLGTDNQRWDHSVYVNVSSSHPNRQVSQYTTASFKNWTFGDEKTQYVSTNETFYIDTPTVGGNTLRSNKVRLDESKLIRDLNPKQRSDISKNDTFAFDTNRLAIVFSPTDQLNNDIYNHSGFTELDDYIADPQYEFEEGYTELNRFSNKYFQKYQQNYNVNKFIKLFSIFDFTFFDQLKQLVPGRADYIGGILIEDDVLHINKVRVTKRPEITNPQYETEYNLDVYSSSAENLTFETIASSSTELGFKYKYFTASIDEKIDFTYTYKYNTASLETNFEVAGELPNNINIEFDTLPTRFSGSQEITQSYIDHYPLNCCYKKVIYHYSSSGTFQTQYLRDWYTAVSKSYGWHYSRSLVCTDYQHLESCATENYKRFYGTRLEGAGINIDSPNTIDGGPVVSIFVSNQSSLYYTDDPLGGNLKVQ